MRKALLFLSVVALGVGVKGFAQTTYTENFEDSENVTWVNQGVNVYQGVTTEDACTGNSYRHNSYSSQPLRILRSPDFQTTGAEISVSFDYKVVNYSGNTAVPANFFRVKLQYSIDGGTTWNDQYVIDENNHVVANTCATINTTIAEGVIPPGEVSFRLQTRRRSGDIYTYFDNISITLTEPSCMSPTGVSASSVEIYTADVYWTASTSSVGEGYQVYYSTSNTPPNDETVLNNTNSVSVGASETIAHLTGLMSSTTYYAWVKAQCSTTDNSNWSLSTSFTTKVSCRIPTDVSSSNITSTTADVSWTASTSSVGEGYQVYYSTEDTAPDSSTVLDETNSVSVGATDTTAQLTGLAPETTYYIWVRAHCDTADYSNWSYKKHFKTKCASKVPNYTEDFNSLSSSGTVTIPCWKLAKGGDASTGYTSLTGSTWRGRSFLENESNSKSVSVNLYSTTRKDWLISPVFDLSGGSSFELTFDYGITRWNSTDASPMGSDDYVQLLVSVDRGNTWTVVETWDVNNNPSNTATTYTLDLAPYVSSQTMIAIYATDGEINDSEDYSFFVDNFAVTDITEVGTINQELTSLEVYPNPATDIINISNDLIITNVEVFDINGRRLLNQNVGQTSATIDVSSFASGTYFVKVTAEGKTSTKQIIVK